MGTGLSLQDAWFEAISGVTTTGLSMLSSVKNQSPSLLFARAWMQWYGGLGIAILSVALLMGQSMASKKLMEPVPGENLVTTTRTHARRVLTAYACLTIIGIVFLLVLQVEPFHAITLTLAAIFTGGFSPFNDSSGRARFHTRHIPPSSTVRVPFDLPPSLCVYVTPWFRRPISDVELPTLLVLCTLAALVVGLSLGQHTHLSWTEALAHGAALGCPLKPGPASVPYRWQKSTNPPNRCSWQQCSSGKVWAQPAGWIKIFRFLIVLVMIRFILQRACAPPHAVVEPWLGNRQLEYKDLTRALLLTLLFIGVIGISWVLFLAGGYDPLDALFEVTSATATVGLSTGITSTDLPG